MLRTRILYCEIQTNDNNTEQLKRLDGLAMGFSCSRKMGDTSNEAGISISNLTNTDIQYLATYTTPFFKPSQPKKLRVFAGYNDIGAGMIYEGDIIEAIPTSQPDTTLNIKSKSLYYAKRIPITYSVENTTNQELGQSIAEELGLQFDWAESNIISNIPYFDFIGSKADLIKEFNKNSDVMIFEDNGVLKSTPKKAIQPNGYIPLISESSGMIGIPEPDKIGVKVQVLMNPQYNLGDYFQLKSKRLSGLNGYYQMYQMDYDLENRGNSFYITILGKSIGR